MSTSNAQTANAREHEMTVNQAVRLYWKALLWSALLSTALVMEGSDGKILGALYAQPAFQKAYGRRSAKGTYEIPAPWQAGHNQGSGVGGIAGLYSAGWLCERFGFRKTVIAGMVMTIAFICIQFFSNSLQVLLVGQILLGFPLGMFQAVTTVYAVEVTPTCLRGYMTTYVNACWLIAAGVMRGMLNVSAPWSYRVPFAVQLFWPIPLIIGLYFAPESPWWLIRQNRSDEAKLALSRLTTPQSDIEFSLDESIALMTFITDHERSVESCTTYRACFRGVNLRSTIIVMGCYAAQLLDGNSLRADSTYLFREAGLPTTWSFNMTIINYSLALVGQIVSWFIICAVGRRTIYIWGLSWIALLFLIIGAIGIPLNGEKNSSLSWAVGGILIMSTFVHNCSIGPVAFSLVSELPSSLLRSKSVAVARLFYNILGVPIGVIIPYMISSTAWGWGALAGFFWGGTCLLMLTFTYFCIPEPKDRTVAELDYLFESNISARKFATTEVTISEILNDRHHV
ncbi:related to Maltose permease [Rhynchosporium graminicola]|uniref:Related to Maltose permease n=1 Tax=Rhynchosporium graminicola TaxID=2792576 RepID=A0A1E1LQX7_9HELO|nr:related to Maltose permease [Rhynchosporium commune]